MSSASRDTPDKYAQYIFVERPYVDKFVTWFVDKQYWFDVQWVRPGNKYQFRFAVNIDLRREFPASLRGKFSSTP